LDPKRQLILRGKMKRKSSLGSSENGLEIQVFLFDHYLVLSKIKHHDQVEYYKVIQKVK
jgi:hypothetical protein